MITTLGDVDGPPKEPGWYLLDAGDGLWFLAEVLKSGDNGFSQYRERGSPSQYGMFSRHVPLALPVSPTVAPPEADAKHGAAPQAGRGTHWWIARSALMAVATTDEAFISSHVAGEIVHVVEVLSAPDAGR